MKYFSLALALFVCVAVSSAAPSQSFEELAFNPLDKINQKLKEYYQKFLCARDVIEKAVDQTEFQRDFEEFKEIVDTVLVDWKMCAEAESKKDYFKCKFEVIKALPEYFGDFFETINKRNAKLAEKIREKVTQKCFVAEETFEFEDTFAPSVADQFQCMADVLGQVSKDNGMEEMWSRTQPIMQRHIDNMKGCANAGNKFMVILCNLREGIAIYKSYVEYLQLAAQQNPKMLQDFIRGLQQKCTGQAFELEALFKEDTEIPEESDKKPAEKPTKKPTEKPTKKPTEKPTKKPTKKPSKPEGIVEKLKCVNKQITKAVKDTDFESNWEQIRKDMEKVGDRVRACNGESSKLEAAKCVFSEIKRANQKIGKFLRNVAETNKEAFNRARQNVRERCF